MVHENFRWQPAIQAVGSALESGAIGKPFWGRVSFRSAFDVFSGQPYLAEGDRFIVEDLGIHVLDIARFLFGDVRQLTASTTRVNPSIKGEDVATMLLRHASGMTSVVDCSYASRFPQELFPQTLIEVDGSEAGRCVSYRTIDFSFIPARAPPWRPSQCRRCNWISYPWKAIQSSVHAIQEHWVDCLRYGREPATSGRDNLQTLALVEAAYASAKMKKTIDVEALLKTDSL